MPTLDYEEAYRILAEIAASDPDHVDQRAAAGFDCQYTPSEEYCGCLIGQVLLKAKVSRAVLVEMDTYSSRIGNHVEILARHDLQLTRDAVSVLTVAQHMQDNKLPWKVAEMAASAAKYDIDDRRRGL